MNWLRRFLFGASAEEIAARFKHFYQVQADFRRWHAEEDRLFDEWWDKGQPGDFEDYERANWASDVPYDYN